MSDRDVAEVYHLLALLESDAAARGARRPPDAQIAAAARRCTTDLEAAGRASATRFFATNEQFHMALLEIAGNRWRIADRGRPAQGDEVRAHFEHGLEAAAS